MHRVEHYIHHSRINEKLIKTIVETGLVEPPKAQGGSCAAAKERGRVCSLNQNTSRNIFFRAHWNMIGNI